MANTQRYWDGQAWTDQRAPLANVVPAAPLLPTAQGATVSLVLGILALVACGLFTGIPAMVMGRQASRAITESQGRLGGSGLATAGFVTGLIGTVLTSLLLAFVIFVFALGAAIEDQMDDNCVETFGEANCR